MKHRAYLRRGVVVPGIDGQRPIDLASRAQRAAAAAAAAADELRSTLAEVDVDGGAIADLARDLHRIEDRIGHMLDELVAPSLAYERRAYIAMLDRDLAAQEAEWAEHYEYAQRHTPGVIDEAGYEALLARRRAQARADNDKKLATWDRDNNGDEK